MNNNCTKCGNPLQPGTTICPICGTNNINANVAPVAPAPAPTADPAVAPAAPVAPAPVADPAAAPVAPVAPAPVAPVAPAAPTTPTAPAASAAPATPAAPTPAAPAAKAKKPVNKKLFIIVGIIAAVIIIGAVVAMIVINNSSAVEEPSPEPSKNNNRNTAVANKMNLNGFSFVLPTGWLVDTTGGNTAIIDSGTTTIVQLLTETGDINAINQENMKNYFSNQGFSNVNVTEKQIGGKKSYVVNTSKESTTYQYDFYYIEASEMIIGSGVVYTDSEAKNKNSAIVEQIMNSLAYSETVNMASEVSMHNDIIRYYEQATKATTSVDVNNNNDGTMNQENQDNQVPQSDQGNTSMGETNIPSNQSGQSESESGRF